MIGLSSTNSFSQEDSTKTEKKYYLVVKIDGSEYRGFILKDDGREILLETNSIGKMYINKSDIKLIKEVDKSETENIATSVAYSDLREQGPFTTRYYFTTNALPIKKKENYAMIHLYGPEVHFAVTDNLSVGVMATWIASPIALALKYSFKNPNPDSDVHFALGAIVGSGGYLSPQSFGGLYFATLTKGNRSSNVSLSAGYSHINTGTIFNVNNNSYRKYFVERNELKENFVPYDFNSDESNSRLTATPNSNNGSLVFGVSGIKAIGKKVSFIFDSMIFITSKQRVVYDEKTELEFTKTETDYSVTPYITTTTKESFTVGVGHLVDGFKPTIILMPGMRFNRKYGSAIQVVLSGVIYERTNYSTGEVNYRGFPVPMVSWLKAF
jgi:hypothetical protein